MTDDPTLALRAAIAASEPVHRARDLIAVAVAGGYGDSARLEELTWEAARRLKADNPHLRESVPEIAEFIAKTASLAAVGVSTAVDIAARVARGRHSRQN